MKKPLKNGVHNKITIKLCNIIRDFIGKSFTIVPLSTSRIARERLQNLEWNQRRKSNNNDIKGCLNFIIHFWIFAKWFHGKYLNWKLFVSFLFSKKVKRTEKAFEKPQELFPHISFKAQQLSGKLSGNNILSNKVGNRKVSEKKKSENWVCELRAKSFHQIFF